MDTLPHIMTFCSHRHHNIIPTTTMEERVVKLCNAVRRARTKRADALGLAAGDLFMAFDSGKPGHQHQHQPTPPTPALASEPGPAPAPPPTTTNHFHHPPPPTARPAPPSATKATTTTPTTSTTHHQHFSVFCSFPTPRPPRRRQHHHDNDMPPTTTTTTSTCHHHRLPPLPPAATTRGRPSGNQRKFLSPWQAPGSKYNKKLITVAYEEDTVRMRRGRAKGIATLPQTETLVCVAKDTISLPERSRKHFNGSNRGSLIAWVQLEPFTDCWPVTFGVKKKCYGKFRVAVGGRTPGCGGSTDEDGDCVGEDQGEEFDLNDIPPVVGGNKDVMKRGDENLEPFSYNSKPVKLYEEMLHTLALRGLYDLSPGDGKAAEACLEARKSYVGICMTDEHKAALFNHLVDRVAEAFGKEASNLYNPASCKRPADLGLGAAPPPTKLAKATAPPPKPKVKSGAAASNKTKKAAGNKEDGAAAAAGGDGKEDDADSDEDSGAAE